MKRCGTAATRRGVAVSFKGMASFFFFGTLLDPVLRQVVVGRMLPEDCIHSAALADFERYHVQGEAYPLLVPQSGAVVDGILVERLSSAEVLRIEWYESDDYENAEVTVTLDRASRVAARCFMPAAIARYERSVWRYADWYRNDRIAALHLAREWMALMGRADIETAERRYLDRKRRLLSADRTAMERHG